jgi:hypothetical protein
MFGDYRTTRRAPMGLFASFKLEIPFPLSALSSPFAQGMTKKVKNSFDRQND